MVSKVRLCNSFLGSIDAFPSLMLFLRGLSMRKQDGKRRPGPFAALEVLCQSVRSRYESFASAMVTSPTLWSCTSGDVMGRMADRGRLYSTSR